MSYVTQLSQDAENFFDKLRDEKLYGRLKNAIKKLENDPRPPQCKKMVGHPDRYRIRVSDYRIIYEVNDGTITVQVLTIGHRREVYD